MIVEDIKLNHLKFHINSILKKDLYKSRNPCNCPVCSSKTYIKYGFFNGIQRYRCKSCGKTFSNSTESLCSYSKKDISLWIEFIELMIERKSLRFCAKKLNINLATAFYWRHKILHGINMNSTPLSLKGTVYLAKMIIPESLKGCRNIKNSRNWSRNIWIISGKGDEDSMFAKPVFRGFWDFAVFNEKVYSKIDKNSYIVIACGDRFLESIAKKHNKNRKLEVNDNYQIQHFILNFKTWLEVYHGIATKYLQRYLSFFILFNLDKVINYMDLMYNHLLLYNNFLTCSDLTIIKDCLY